MFISDLLHELEYLSLDNSISELVISGENVMYDHSITLVERFVKMVANQITLSLCCYNQKPTNKKCGTIGTSVGNGSVMEISMLLFHIL